MVIHILIMNKLKNHISPYDVFNSSYGINPGIQETTTIEVNYTQPLGENAMFETGGKTDMAFVNSNSSVYLQSPFTGTYDYNIHNLHM